MEKQTWIVELEESKPGEIMASLLTYSPGSPTLELLNGRWFVADVLFQELLTLLDSSLWSFMATMMVRLDQPTLGGYARLR